MGTLHRAFGRRSVVHIRPVVASNNATIGAIPRGAVVRDCMHNGDVRTVSSTGGGIGHTLANTTLTLNTGVSVHSVPNCRPLVGSSVLVSITERTLDRMLPSRGFVRANACSSSDASVNSVSTIVPAVRPCTPNTNNVDRNSSCCVTRPSETYMNSTR